VVFNIAGRSAFISVEWQVKTVWFQTASDAP